LETSAPGAAARKRLVCVTIKITPIDTDNFYLNPIK